MNVTLKITCGADARSKLEQLLMPESRLADAAELTLNQLLDAFRWNALVWTKMNVTAPKITQALLDEQQRQARAALAEPHMVEEFAKRLLPEQYKSWQGASIGEPALRIWRSEIMPRIYEMAGEAPPDVWEPVGGIERRADETHATYKRSPSSYDEGAADALDVLLAEMRRTT